MHIKKSLLLLIFTINIFSTPVNADDRLADSREIPFTLKDSDRLTRTETLVELMDKRIDQIDKRIGKLEGAGEYGTSNDSDRLQRFMFVAFGIMIFSMLALIAYVLWDRRRLCREYSQPKN